MKFLLSAVLMFSIVFTVNAQSALENVAQLLAKHNYKKVYKCFDANMKQKVPKTDLGGIWEQMEAAAGKLQSVKDFKEVKTEEGLRQTATLQFDQAAVKMILSQNTKGKINGLYITHLAYSTPSYGQDLGVGKKYTNFISNGYNISGELMIPLNCNECPVVVLVHGSGPNDKDETIGPNKVFYDLALGFASKGIATYRYNKRSNLYPEAFKGQFDLYDETINDAIAALNHIKADTSLHFGKYVMLGHSLGAYALPIIADSLESELNGAILFSANARKLEDLIEYQMKYLTGFDQKITKEESKIIKENTARAQDIRTGNYTKQTSAENLLAYWPGTFWKGIQEYSPVKTLAANKTTPFFILQGEKDYQITLEDFAIWQSTVGMQSNVKMQSYAGLTHLFTPTKAINPSPSDYFLPSNVEFQVIWDMADWIKLVVK